MLFLCLYEDFQRTKSVALSGWQFLIGGLIMMLCGYAAGGRLTVWTGKGVLLLLYMAMISAVAYSLWSILLKYNPVSKVAVFGFMNPVCGVILSAVLLGETGSLSVMSVAALVLVCMGIYIVNRPERQNKKEEPMSAIVTLKKGEGRTIKAGGMWVFDNEIDTVTGTFENGEVVLVHDFDGYPMGRGFINVNSKIRVRMLTRKIDQEIDRAFLRMRVQNAWDYRKTTVDTSSCRVIFGRRISCRDWL